MPRNITVTFDDGSSHIYQNAPDDVTPDQVIARAAQDFGKPIAHLDGGRSAPSAPIAPDAPAPSLLDRAGNALSFIDNVARSGATGVPVLGGLANRADAGVDALASYALNPLFSKDQQLQGSIGDRYRQALAVQNGMDQQFQQAHPYIATGANIAGGLAAGGGAGKLGLTLAGRFGTGAMTGLQGIAARAGLATAENALLGGADAATRGQSPVQGAEFGGALGAGNSLARNIGGRGIGGLLLRGTAATGIGAGVGAAGAAATGGDVAEGAAMGGFGSAAGEAATEGAGAVQRTFSPHEVARQRLAEVTAAEGLNPDMISQRLGEAGPNARLMDVSPVLRQMAAALVTEPGQARSTITHAINAREAGSGQRIADLLTSTFGPRMDGNGVLQKFQDERNQASGPLYATAKETPVVDSDELQSIMQTPAFKSALADANTLAGNEGYSLYSPTGEMGMHGPVLVPDVSKMTLRDLHYVQRAMQDNIRNIKVGAGFRDNEVSLSIAGVRKRLLGAMDEMSPDYQKARSIYAGNSSVQDAYDQGLKSFTAKTTPEDELRTLNSFENASERQAYLIGARQRISNVMGQARNNRAKSYNFFGIGNDNPEFSTQEKIANLLAFAKPPSSQADATGAILKEMRGRMGYADPNPSPEEGADEIMPDDVHEPGTLLLNEHGEAVHPESEEGRGIIAERIRQATAERETAKEQAEEEPEKEVPGLQFTEPDMKRGQMELARLLSGLSNERNMAETANKVTGNSFTAERLAGRQMIAHREPFNLRNLSLRPGQIAAEVGNALLSPVIDMRNNAINKSLADALISRDANAALRPEQAQRENVAAAIMDRMRGPAEGARVSPEDEAEARRHAQRAYLPTNRDIIARALLTAALTQGNQNQQGQR